MICFVKHINKGEIMNNNQQNHFKKTALLSALLLEITVGVQAATIEVDGTSCTLHDAIEAANTDMATGGCPAGSGDDVLELPVNGDLVLSSELPTINQNLTIEGRKATIRRDAAAPPFTVLRTYNQLTLNDVTISGGQSTSSANRGGGIYAFYAEINVNKSEISNNTGGAIYAYSGNLIMTDSVVSNNTGQPNANSGSAGIALIGASNSTITRSTISGNQNLGNSKGAAINVSNSYFYSSNVEVSNSTISGNSSMSGGGAIHANETYYYLQSTSMVLTLNNVTLTNNMTSEDGGAAVVSDGRLILNHNLISGNHGTLVDEILNLGGQVITNGYNLIGLDGSSGSVGVIIGVTDAVIAEPDINMVLNPVLMNNGGLTATHQLNPQSPAIDFVPNAACIFNEDQAGSLRPIDGDGDGTADCDVGAVEYSDIIFENGFD